MNRSKLTLALRVPSGGPLIFPGALRSAMDEQEDGILLFLALLEPGRLHNPALDLVLRTVKVELLSGVQGLALERGGGELRELLDVRLARVVAPKVSGLVVLAELADDEDVVGRCEAGAREQKPAIGQGLDAGRGASQGDRLGKKIVGQVWVRGRLFRSLWQRNGEHSDTSKIARGQIEDFALRRELAAQTSTNELLDKQIQKLTASSVALRSHFWVRVYLTSFLRS